MKIEEAKLLTEAARKAADSLQRGTPLQIARITALQVQALCDIAVQLTKIADSQNE